MSIDVTGGGSPGAGASPGSAVASSGTVSLHQGGQRGRGAAPGNESTVTAALGSLADQRNMNDAAG